MTTKDTMTQTQTLALAYAEKLVAYYAAKITDDETVVRRAYNALCTAQNALAYEAEREAEQ